jgi:hypothetical protein
MPNILLNNDTPSIIKNFYEFIQDKSIADFEELYSSDGLETLVSNTNLLKNLIPFGLHGSGSFIAIWLESQNESLDKNPIVWIDSEGGDPMIICENFKDFLSLLIYDTGHIYDLVSSCIGYMRRPKNKVDPIIEYNYQTLSEWVSEKRKQYANYNDLETFLISNQINISNNPVELIRNAIIKHQDQISKILES